MLSCVSIVKAEKSMVETAVRKAVELSGGLTEKVTPQSTVLIKPNVYGAFASGSGLVTDARVVEATVKLVQEAHPRRIVIGEGSSVGYDAPDLRGKDTQKAFKKSGMDKVAHRLDVELVDLNQDEQVEVSPGGARVMKKFKVARTAFESNFIISVPVLKTHIRTDITCSLKNMKGVLPGLEKRRSHRVGLDRAIVDLNRVVKPHFTIVDAITCMEGTWSYPEDTVKLNLIVAAEDPVSVDAVCASIMKLNVKKVLHIELAEEQKLGIADLDSIQVRGEDISSVAREFRLYNRAFRERFKDLMIVEKDTCSGCMGELVSMLIYLDKAGYKEKLRELTLVMGTPLRVPEDTRKKVIVGKCAKNFQDEGLYVPGCPPQGGAIVYAACKALNIDKNKVQEVIKNLHRTR